jgi:uncharacterized protein YaaW (UPF0174 family)
MTFTSETKDMLGRVPCERLKPIYERHEVEPSKGSNALVDEIRLDGSNTFASIFRGWEGVDYGEVVGDVAKQLGLTPGGRGARDLEVGILEIIIQKYLENAAPEERENITKILEQAGGDFNRRGADFAKAAFRVGTLALLIRRVGAKVVGQIVRKIMLRIAGRQAAKEAGKRVAQLAGMAIPVLDAVMIVWTVVDIAGPAFRKTVPTAIEIALLRLEYGEER